MGSAVVSVFNSDSYMHTGRGVPALIQDLESFDNKAIHFAAVGPENWNTSRAAVLLIPELYKKLLLDESSSIALRSWVENGGHLVVCGDYWGHNGRFLNAVFGWSL